MLKLIVVILMEVFAFTANANIGCPPDTTHMDNYCAAACIEKKPKKKGVSGHRANPLPGHENDPEFVCIKVNKKCTGNIVCNCTNADGATILSFSVACCDLDPFNNGLIENGQ